MSGKVMGWVWDSDLPRAEKYILLAYADHADHQGRGIFPSVGLVAWKTGYDERHVKRIKKELLQKEVLQEYGTSEYGTPIYALIKKNLPERDDYIQNFPGRPKADEKGGDKMSPLNEKRGDISNKKGVTFSQKGVTPESPKPSFKPSLGTEREEASTSHNFQGSPDSSSLTLEQLNGRLDAVYKICGIKNPTNKQVDEAKEAAAYIDQQGDTIEDIKRFKEAYWWGKTPPHPSQVRSEWDRFKATMADKEQEKRAVRCSVDGVQVGVEELRRAMRATEDGFEKRKQELLEQGRQLAARGK